MSYVCEDYVILHVEKLVVFDVRRQIDVRLGGNRVAKELRCGAAAQGYFFHRCTLFDVGVS